jgi:hypothetical protein
MITSAYKQPAGNVTAHKVHAGLTHVDSQPKFKFKSPKEDIKAFSGLFSFILFNVSITKPQTKKGRNYKARPFLLVFFELYLPEQLSKLIFQVKAP